LGHATRDLQLIRGLLESGYAVSIVSAGRALRLLREELGGLCDYHELHDIPKPLSRHAPLFYIKMSLALPLVFRTFHLERRFVESLCRSQRFDCIISDSRYGICHRDTPSFYLVHSLRQIIPGRPRMLEKLVEFSQKRLLSGAVKIIIPDERVQGLAGELCHDLACSWDEKLEYIGILSSIQRRPVEEDIDYFISISGAEPQRSIFEKIILSQFRRLPGRVVITLGKPESRATPLNDANAVIHQYMDRAQQQEMMNRARLVVSRSGYTTMMELAELGRRALLVPTVGQSEQEYLANYHERLGHLHRVVQRGLDLVRDTEAAERYAGLPPFPPTKESVDRFLRAISV
jgi:UDP-N-acetylglucosamine transferase subunit ALG13